MNLSFALLSVMNMFASEKSVASTAAGVTVQDLYDIYNIYKKAVNEKIKKEDLLSGTVGNFSIDPSTNVTQGVVLQVGTGWQGRNGGSDELRSKFGTVPLLQNYKFNLPQYSGEDFDEQGVIKPEKAKPDPRDAFDKELIDTLGLVHKSGKKHFNLVAGVAGTYNITMLSGKKMPDVTFGAQPKDTHEYKSKCMKFEDQEDPEHPEK